MTTYDAAGTTYDSATTTYDGTGVTPVTAGPYPAEETVAITTKAGVAVKYGKTYAANVIAGTKGLDYIGALNVAAGNSKTNYRDHEGVLNQLAGTKGWGANAAASRYAGLY